MNSFRFSTHKNNFNLLRFFAAIQVFISHYFWHFKVNLNDTSIIFYKYFSNFAGVPIFFFISGFLIYQSFHKIKVKNYKDKLKIFFYNRFLRIYPALLVFFFLSFFILCTSGYLENKHINIKILLNWIISQITIFQFYNPSWLREYGTGVANGSLWTIPVEIQFYFLMPIIYFFSKKKKTFLIILLSFIVLSLIIPIDRNTIIKKIYHITFFPHIYIFLFGCLIASNQSIIKYILNLNFFFLFIVHLIVSQFFSSFLIINQLLIFLIIIKIGFLDFKIVNKFFHTNDLSYAIYLYHMPIINFILYKDIKENFFLILLTLLIISFCSWNFIEKIFLRKKI